MLRLTVAQAAPPALLIDDLDPERVKRWRDVAGEVVAWGQIAGGTHRMVVPRVGTFSFSGEEVVATPEPAASPELLGDAFRRMVLPLALQALGHEVLHASAVLSPDGVIALCARSTTGKSTLAYALSQTGYPLWADDAVAVARSGGGFAAVSLPFGLRLRPASAEFFGMEAGTGSVPPQAERTEREQERLAALCVLERSGPGEQPDVEVERLRPADAFPALIDHAYCFSLDEMERKRQMMRDYLDITSRVPVFRVRFGEGLDRVPAIVEGISAAVAEAAASHRRA